MRVRRPVHDGACGRVLTSSGQRPVKVIVLVVCPRAEATVKVAVSRTTIGRLEVHVVDADEASVSSAKLSRIACDALQVNLRQ